jgi:uncharacterized protein CbrC (UPF0167 family)
MSTKQIDTDVKNNSCCNAKKAMHYGGALFTIKALQWIVFSPAWCIPSGPGAPRICNMFQW